MGVAGVLHTMDVALTVKGVLIILDAWGLEPAVSQGVSVTAPFLAPATELLVEATTVFVLMLPRATAEAEAGQAVRAVLLRSDHSSCVPERELRSCSRLRALVHEASPGRDLTYGYTEPLQRDLAAVFPALH